MNCLCPLILFTSAVLALVWCDIPHVLSVLLLHNTSHRCFCKENCFFLYFMSKKNTKNKQAIMTFAVLLSLFSDFSERLTDLQKDSSVSELSVPSLQVISLNVSHHLFLMSCATFPPLRSCAPVILLCCFELPEPHRDTSGQSRDIYKQAEGNVIMLLTPALDPGAPGRLQITTFPLLSFPRLLKTQLHQLMSRLKPRNFHHIYFQI